MVARLLYAVSYALVAVGLGLDIYGAAQLSWLGPGQEHPRPFWKYLVQRLRGKAVEKARSGKPRREELEKRFWKYIVVGFLAQFTAAVLGLVASLFS